MVGTVVAAVYMAFLLYVSFSFRAAGRGAARAAARRRQAARASAERSRVSVETRTDAPARGSEVRKVLLLATPNSNSATGHV